MLICFVLLLLRCYFTRSVLGIMLIFCSISVALTENEHIQEINFSPS